MDELKLELRRKTWDAIRAAGAARFPGTHGRIPHFVGAEAAARQLQSIPEWRQAQTLKCNPDMPQREVRRAALVEGKRVYLAVPRLVEPMPFIMLDPHVIPPESYWQASSIKGAFEWGQPVELSEMDPIDLIVTGCVAVGEDGTRLGKGGGYSDLEFALLLEHGLVGADVPVLTTVHPVQTYPAQTLPRAKHDLTIDLVVMPGEVQRIENRKPRPQGIIWSALSPEKKASIPALCALEGQGLVGDE